MRSQSVLSDQWRVSICDEMICLARPVQALDSWRAQRSWRGSIAVGALPCSERDARERAVVELAAARRLWSGHTGAVSDAISGIGAPKPPSVLDRTSLVHCSYIVRTSLRRCANGRAVTAVQRRDDVAGEMSAAARAHERVVVVAHARRSPSARAIVEALGARDGTDPRASWPELSGTVRGRSC